MFWSVLYNRPRGVPGNYKVAIAVSLREGEMIAIERYGSSTEVEEVEDRMPVYHRDIGFDKNPFCFTVTKIFALRRVIPGDGFRITITDPDVAWPQKNYYQATPIGLTGGVEAGSIALYTLYLVDLDLIPRNSPQWNALFTGYSDSEWKVIRHLWKTLNIP